MITLETLRSEITENQAVLLYFYSDKCAPCLSLRPKVEQLLLADYPAMKLILVDSERYPEITAQYGVFSNPTLLLFFDGHEHQRLSKYVSVSQLSETIARPYSMLIG